MKKLMMGICAIGSVAGAQTSPDTLLGPVVAVQRHITEAESKCLNHLTGQTDQPSYVFSCRIELPLDLAKETVVNPIQSFFLEDACSVEINYLRGGVVIFFGNPKAPATFDEAKVCLNKGLSKSQNKIEVLVFKVQ